MKKKFIKTPLVGVQVHGAKDVGTRTVNLLMGEHAGEYVRGDIMDANAVIQAFDELKGNVDNNHDSLEEIVNEIHNFRDTTNHRFDVFQEKAEEETANRIQGDNTLDDKIDQKESESNERDNVLQQNIDTEKQERVNADTQLRNDLTAEVNRAKANENALSSDIQAEATKRENDDNTIKDNLNAEVTRATAKENEIKEEVDVINGDSTTEGSFRKAIADVVGAAPEAYDTLKEIADKLDSNDDLHTAINDAIATKATTVALNEEITRAKAAEAENKSEIAAEAARAKEVEGDNALAIQNEASRATTAETAINESLNTEIDRAKGQEAYLQNLVNAKADTTALDGAKADLDKKILDETTRATYEEDELRYLITTEQNRATTSEKSITDDLNGKLVQKADTTALNNYVLTTALDEQVNILNTAIGTKVDSTTFSQNIGSVYNDLNNKITNNTQNINSVANGLSGQITANKKSIDSNKKSIDSFHGEFTSYQDYMNQQINGLNSEIAKKQEKGNYIPYEIGLAADYYKITDGLEIETSNHIGGGGETVVYISGNGIHFKDKSANQIPTANWDFIDINDYALKTELPTAGIPYDPSVTNVYQTNKQLAVKLDDQNTATFGPNSCISLKNTDANIVGINYAGMSLKLGSNTFSVNPGGIKQVGSYKFDVNNNDGIKWCAGIADNAPYAQMNLYGLNATINDNMYTKCDCINGLDIKYAGPHSGSQTSLNHQQLLMKESDDRQVLLTPEQLLIKNDQTGAKLQYISNRLVVQYGSDKYVELGPFANGASGGLSIHKGNSEALWIYPDQLIIQDGSGSTRDTIRFNYDGITHSNDYISFTNHLIQGFDIYLYNSTRGKLSKTIEDIYTSKQNKITPTAELDLTSIDTADIQSLRSIVKALATELNTLGLIKLKSAEETA